MRVKKSNEYWTMKFRATLRKKLREIEKMRILATSGDEQARKWEYEIFGVRYLTPAEYLDSQESRL